MQRSSWLSDTAQPPGEHGRPAVDWGARAVGLHDRVPDRAARALDRLAAAPGEASVLACEDIPAEPGVRVRAGGDLEEPPGQVVRAQDPGLLVDQHDGGVEQVQVAGDVDPEEGEEARMTGLADPVVDGLVGLARGAEDRVAVGADGDHGGSNLGAESSAHGGKKGSMRGGERSGRLFATAATPSMSGSPTDSGATMTAATNRECPQTDSDKPVKLVDLHLCESEDSSERTGLQLVVVRHDGSHPAAVRHF